MDYFSCDTGSLRTEKNNIAKELIAVGEVRILCPRNKCYLLTMRASESQLGDSR